MTKDPTPEAWVPSRRLISGTGDLYREINHSIMEPVIKAMADRGIPFKGALYAGIMLTPDGPQVLEFNCRLGDPEAQVVLPQLLTDPLELMTACIEGRLDSMTVEWSDRPHVGVVMVSGGYPGDYRTGLEIDGLFDNRPDTVIFQAGTRLVEHGDESKTVTAGGRVLAVVGSGDSLAQARSAAYHGVREISFDGAYYRTDIAAVEGKVFT